MAYPIHSDKRGYFQELYHVLPGETVKQVSWFSIRPGCERGGHYHKDTSEVFIVIEGFVTATLDDKSFFMMPGDTLVVKPPQKHSFHSVIGAKMVVLSDKHFDPDNTDTFTSP